MSVNSMKPGIIVILFTFFITCCLSAHAQNDLRTVKLKLAPQYKKAALILDHGPDTNGMHFETFRFFISALELTHDNKVVWKEADSYHLIDASDSTTLQILMKIPVMLTYDSLRFNLGIDSITNVSGAMGGDLDPTNGMYWTWQSGYINLKVEGRSSLSAEPSKKFQFHLGGYMNPYNSCRSVSIGIRRPDEILMLVELDKLMSEADLKESHTIMSPGIKASALSDAAAKMFSSVP